MITNLGGVIPLTLYYGDLNIIEHTCALRTVGGQTSNVPDGFVGIVLTFAIGSYYLIQMGYASSATEVYYRVKWDEGWRTWRKIV